MPCAICACLLPSLLIRRIRCPKTEKARPMPRLSLNRSSLSLLPRFTRLLRRRLSGASRLRFRYRSRHLQLARGRLRARSLYRILARLRHRFVRRPGMWLQRRLLHRRFGGRRRRLLCGRSSLGLWRNLGLYRRFGLRRPLGRSRLTCRSRHVPGRCRLYLSSRTRLL
jgi:hypothetical protein